MQLFIPHLYYRCVKFGVNDCFARNPVGDLSETTIQFRWKTNQLIVKIVERRSLDNWRTFTFRINESFDITKIIFIYATKLR